MSAEEVKRLRAENAELKARLKAARRVLSVVAEYCDDTGSGPSRSAFEAATDLRVKNWRKP